MQTYLVIAFERSAWGDFCIPIPLTTYTNDIGSCALFDSIVVFLLLFLRFTKPSLRPRFGARTRGTFRLFSCRSHNRPRTKHRNREKFLERKLEYLEISIRISLRKERPDILIIRNTVCDLFACNCRCILEEQHCVASPKGFLFCVVKFYRKLNSILQPYLTYCFNINMTT